MLDILIPFGFSLGVIWWIGRELGFWKFVGRWIERNKGKFDDL